jgi:hypothetical protein
MNRPRRGAAGQLEGSQRCRDGTCTLKEAPSVHPESARGVIDGRSNEVVHRLVTGSVGGRDELSIGDRSSSQGEVGRFVLLISKPSRKLAHGRLRGEARSFRTTNSCA